MLNSMRKFEYNTTYNNYLYKILLWVKHIACIIILLPKNKQ